MASSLSFNPFVPSAPFFWTLANSADLECSVASGSGFTGISIKENEVCFFFFSFQITPDTPKIDNELRMDCSTRQICLK